MKPEEIILSGVSSTQPEPATLPGFSNSLGCPLVQPSAIAYRFGWFDWFCLWYPPGWLILFNRHWQHYNADPDGWNWLEYGLFLIPGGFYLALLLRWLRLGCRSPRPVTEAINPNYQIAFREEILTPILKHYFRAELLQAENLPTKGSFIVLINHAGMCFPWDFLGLGTLLSQARGWFVQPLAHPIFFEHPWLQWWLPAGWSRVLGGVRADRQSFDRSFDRAAQETVLLCAPEGWRGLAKGWQQRHQLSTFDPSFIQVSARHRIPLLPVVCQGSEYLHPWAQNMKWFAKRFKMPMFPVSPLLPVFALFPSMGVWAMRTRLRYVIQPLEQTWDETQASGKNRLMGRSLAYQKAQEVRSRMQSVLDKVKGRFS